VSDRGWGEGTWSRSTLITERATPVPRPTAIGPTVRRAGRSSWATARPITTTRTCADRRRRSVAVLLGGWDTTSPAATSPGSPVAVRATVISREASSAVIRQCTYTDAAPARTSGRTRVRSRYGDQFRPGTPRRPRASPATAGGSTTASRSTARVGRPCLPDTASSTPFTPLTPPWGPGDGRPRSRGVPTLAPYEPGDARMRLFITRFPKVLPDLGEAYGSRPFLESRVDHTGGCPRERAQGVGVA
jgi:hypothetical protein